MSAGEEGTLSGPGPDHRVTRVMSRGVETALDQFASPEVLAAGKVNVIALDAVVERFGERWRSRREQVHTHVQATLDRHLRDQGYYLLISETDVLICQPLLGKLAGQASCLRVLREILNHFLGDGELADVGVHEVTSVSSDGVEARRVDARAAYAGAEAEARQKASDPAHGVGPEGAPPLGSVDRSAPFVTSRGRRVHVACDLTSVIELKGGRRIGLRLSGRVTHDGSGDELTSAELAMLARSDRLRIDLAVIATGLDALRMRTDAAPPTLIVPMSFFTLSNSDGRARMIGAFKAAQTHGTRGLICELRDIDGVPPSTLLTIVAMVRPFSVLVTGHVQEAVTAASRLRDAGLQGVSMDCPPNLDGAAFIGWAKAAISAAKMTAKSVLIYQVPSQRQAGLVASLGASHASFRTAG